MAQSLARILIHYVFSTKYREPLLTDSIRDRLHGYIGGIVEERDGTLLRAGSVENHIHLLVAHPRTYSPAQIVEKVKTGSSKWLKLQGPEFAGFRWQLGYAAFSVYPPERHIVERYLDRQAVHHRRVHFMDEYRGLLVTHEVEYDERYMWD